MPQVFTFTLAEIMSCEDILNKILSSHESLAEQDSLSEAFQSKTARLASLVNRVFDSLVSDAVLFQQGNVEALSGLGYLTPF